MTASASAPTMNPTETIVPEFHLALVGDGGTGKGAFIKTLLSSYHQHDSSHHHDSITYYRSNSSSSSNNGIAQHDVVCYTNLGPILYHIQIIGRDPKTGQMDHSIGDEVDGAIIMFNVMSRYTFHNIPQWQAALPGEKQLPTVLCSSGIHMKGRKIRPRQIEHFSKLQKLPYCGISVRDPTSVEQPFLHLSRRLLNDKHLQVLGCDHPYREGFNYLYPIVGRLSCPTKLELLVLEILGNPHHQQYSRAVAFLRSLQWNPQDFVSSDPLDHLEQLSTYLQTKELIAPL